jgi:hypothetical protein
MEVNKIMHSFLENLVSSKVDSFLGYTVYRKPTHMDLYFHVKSDHHLPQTKSVLKTPFNWRQRRRGGIYDDESLDKEINHLKRTFR